jgi:hypothetical protein
MWSEIEKILAHTARTHPGHVNLKHVPFASRTLNVNAPMSGSIRRTNVFVNSANQANRNARVYYTPLTQGLSYRRANGSFIDVSHANVPHGLRLFPGGRARVLAEVQLMLSPAMNEYGTFLAPGSGPRMAGPLSNAELLNNITHQIFSGRGNINATRYTNDQKQRLAAKLKNKIHTLKNKYKKQKADGVNEKIYGMARNQMLAYQRGLAAERCREESTDPERDAESVDAGECRTGKLRETSSPEVTSYRGETQRTHDVVFESGVTHQIHQGRYGRVHRQVEPS